MHFFLYAWNRILALFVYIYKILCTMYVCDFVQFFSIFLLFFFFSKLLDSSFILILFAVASYTMMTHTGYGEKSLGKHDRCAWHHNIYMMHFSFQTNTKYIAHDVLGPLWRILKWIIFFFESSNEATDIALKFVRNTFLLLLPYLLFPFHLFGVVSVWMNRLSTLHNWNKCGADEDWIAFCFYIEIDSDTLNFKAEGWRKKNKRDERPTRAHSHLPLLVLLFRH